MVFSWLEILEEETKAEAPHFTVIMKVELGEGTCLRS